MGKFFRKFGLAALLAATELPVLAQGSIVYVNGGDHVIISRGSPTIYYDIDMDGNDTVDFSFKAGGSFQILSTIGNRSIAVGQGGNDLGSFSIPQMSGDEIGSTLSMPLEWTSSFQPGFPAEYWIGQTLHFADSSGTRGPWQPNMTAYLGVEFSIDGNNHYGWIRLSTWFIDGVNGGIVHDWAYNTVPGEAILAGQVPEPSTWALLIGGGALLCWRFRKGRRRD